MVAAKAASKPDYGAWIIGGAALLLLAKYQWDLIGEKVNIVPETKQFTGSLFGQGRKGVYIEDQTGLSPNPAGVGWWNDYGSGDMGGLLPRKPTGPIEVINGGEVPTPPVVSIGPRTAAEKAGEGANRWFTNPVLYPWFALADRL